MAPLSFGAGAPFYKLKNMKTLKLETPIARVNDWLLLKFMAVLLLYLLAQFIPNWLQSENNTVGVLDPSIWQLWLFAMFSFVLVTLGIWLLLQWFWLKLGLPTIHSMVSQFKNLTLWQQFVCYWASFALLFLGALLAQAAIF